MVLLFVALVEEGLSLRQHGPAAHAGFSVLRACAGLGVTRPDWAGPGIRRKKEREDEHGARGLSIGRRPECRDGLKVEGLY